MPYILSLVTFLPLLGAAAIFATRLGSKTQEAAAPAARWIALVTTLVVLAVSVVLVAGFDPANTGYQFVEFVPWFAGASYWLSWSTWFCSPTKMAPRQNSASWWPTKFS